MGRFLSPDPLGIIKQKIVDPQQWSMYSYTRNNPLRFTDPTGMYTCTASASECKRLADGYAAAEKGLAAMNKKSKEYKQLKSTLTFLGKPGFANYVSIGTQSLKPGVLGHSDTTQSSGHTITQIKVDLKQAHAFTQIVSGHPAAQATDESVGGLVVHEGTHGVDDYPKGRNPGTEAEEFRTEMNAYGVESQMFKALNLKSTLGNLWDPNWLPGEAEDKRKAGVSDGAKQSTAEWCAARGGC